jgi:outer membrane protein assembly factor BamB
MKKSALFLCLMGICIIFVTITAYANPESPLVVNSVSVSNRVAYHQTQWYNFQAEEGKGYCVAISGSRDIEVTVLDQNLAVIGEVSEEYLDAEVKKIWVSPSVAEVLRISIYGIDNPSADYTLQVASAPYLSSIDPASGCTAMIMTLDGSGFRNNRGSSFVKFGSIKAFNYASWSDSQIKVYIPTNIPMDTIPVTVTVAGVTSNAINFSPIVSSNGTMWHYDLGNTGNSPYGPTATPLFQRWIYKGSGSIYSDLVFANGMLYFAEGTGVAAVNAKTGQLKWKYDPHRSGIRATPVFADGKVYFASEDTLYVLNAKTGKLIWNYVLGYWIDSIVIFDNKVYCPVGNKLYAVDIETKQLKWKRNFMGDNIMSSPAIAKGIIYIGIENRLYALDTRDGAIKWVRYLRDGDDGIYVDDAVAVVDNTVYFCPTNGVWGGYVWALDASTGKTKWRYRTAGWYETPAVANNAVYCLGVNNLGPDLIALDANTGKEKWRFTENWAADQISPWVSKGILYVTGYTPYTADYRLFAINAETGISEWDSGDLDIGGVTVGKRLVFSVQGTNDGSGKNNIICFGQ